MSALLPVTLDRRSGRPLGVQLADQVRALVLSGVLATGDRLPSTRRLASDLGVSRAVAEQAWDQLRAEGWIEARQGSGTYVAGGPGPGVSSVTSRARAPRRPSSRASTSTRALVLMDAGTPWVDERHRALWRRAWREVSTARPPRGYDDPLGLPELRERVAARLSMTRGLAVRADDVRITSGTTAGLRNLLAVLPRADVAVEDPGYRAAVLTIEETGRAVRDLPALAAVRDLSGACAAYVTPAHQHPLGRVMPAEDRLTLLATAGRDGALVIEDDYDSEFRYDVAPVPALAALDPGLVAYLGTASKSVAPSLRLGWMVVPELWRESFDRHRAITHDVPAWAVQHAFCTMLRDGYVDALVRSARRVYAERAPRVVAALSPYAELAGPVAGMYSTWLLSQERAVAAQAAAERAGFRVKLLRDYCRSAGLSGLVVGFGGPTDEQLDEALAVLVASLA